MVGKKQVRGLAKFLPEWTWNYTKRKPIASFNPSRIDTRRTTVAAPEYTLFSYNAASYTEQEINLDEACSISNGSGTIKWINIDGLNIAHVERLCKHFKVHPLIVEDILSQGQRAKMDETGDLIFCLLPMLYYNDGSGQIETEQVSMVLGPDFLLSFQEDPERDVFDAVRERIRLGNTKLRQSSADYLCYSLIDVIVDSYFGIIDKMNDRIERLEDSLLLQKERAALEKISILRREIMVLRRSILPVRELVSSFIRSDSELLEEQHEKYYKDVQDHIIQANDYVESYRDMLMNMQDLSMSQINLRMNEVMKVFTLLATLMAPATVIGGIFGMNFDVIPLAHQEMGFFITVSIMLAIPLLMMIWFKRKGWF